jgi:retinol dehydrogenase-12
MLPARDRQRILITGANTGIGRATALLLAQRGATLYLAGRSEERHREVLDSVRALGAEATYLPLDLGDLSSVRACAARFLSLDVPLHVLINNAGLAGSRGLTKDGFERTFGVNHLGHFLLTELLLQRLRDSAPSRIVNVSSKAHYGARGIEWAALRRPTRTALGFFEYEVSKLCNVLHAKDLARRLDGSGVTTYSLHPGVVASDVWRHVPWGVRHLIRLFMQSNEQGAATLLHCAIGEQAAQQTGLYYDASEPAASSALSLDVALANLLRDKSLEWVGAVAGR